MFEAKLLFAVAKRASLRGGTILREGRGGGRGTAKSQSREYSRTVTNDSPGVGFVVKNQSRAL